MMPLLCCNAPSPAPLSLSVDAVRPATSAVRSCVESSDVKAALAVLTFILSSAARYNVDSAPLSDELQQLGLPKGLSQPCPVFPSATIH